MTNPPQSSQTSRPGRSVDDASSASLQSRLPQRKRTFLHNVGERFAQMRVAPLSNYYMILIVVGMLTTLGLVMVMSSSMSMSILETSSAWAQASRQAMMVALGLVAMWVAMKVKLATVRRYSGILLGIAILLLIAVLIPGIGTGLAETGSQSWIVLGPLRLQPSEVARVAIAVWGAAYLSERTKDAAERRRRFFIYGTVAVIMTFLIFAERDLGMGISFFLVAFVMGIFAGMHIKVMLYTVAIGALGVLALLVGGGFRSARFTVYFDALVGHFADTRGAAFQSYQGFLSLADGSLFGLGLGQSRAKWFYLPEAKNDFIFAIVGEELGLVGASIVVILFCLLGYFGLRTARYSANQFTTLMAATLTTAIVLQAFINMGYVVGLFPVTGIQLPLLSSGGTSAIITLGAMGLLVNCARHEPQAISYMANYGRPSIDHLLFLPEPRMENVNPYPPSPTQARATRGQHDGYSQREDFEQRRSQRYRAEMPPSRPAPRPSSTGSMRVISDDRTDYPARPVRRRESRIEPRTQPRRANADYRDRQGTNRGPGTNPRDDRRRR